MPHFEICYDISNFFYYRDKLNYRKNNSITHQLERCTLSVWYVFWVVYVLPVSMSFNFCLTLISAMIYPHFCYRDKMNYRKKNSMTHQHERGTLAVWYVFSVFYVLPVVIPFNFCFTVKSAMIYPLFLLQRQDELQKKEIDDPSTWRMYPSFLVRLRSRVRLASFNSV